jgi:DNA polymerase-3 subunit delta
LEKLFLYVGDAGVATAADVAAVVGDAAEGQSDAVIAAALAGDHERTETVFFRYLAGGGSAAALSTLLLRHLVQLASLRAEADGGLSPSVALDRARPPAFGRRRAAIEADLKLWTGEALEAARRRVFDAIAATRMQPSLDDAVISDALQALALIARRLQRQRAPSS